MEAPTWYLPGLLRDGQRASRARTHFTEPIYDPSVTGRFNLYLTHTTEPWDGIGIVACTVILPAALSTLASSQSHQAPSLLSLEKQVRSQPLPYCEGRELFGEWNRDGFRFLIYRSESGSELRVSSHNDIMRGGEKGVLKVLIPTEEMRCNVSDVLTTMIDEASGRVLIRRWSHRDHRRGVYIWDLV